MKNFFDEQYILENNVRYRSISAENPDGEKGKGGMSDIPPEERKTHFARDLGKGFKVHPSICLKAREIAILADIKNGGVINHIWMTVSSLNLRGLIIRFYWDDCSVPSVQCPLGDFFFLGWEQYAPINSAFVSVNPRLGMNCFWQMPFRRNAKITLENISDEDMTIFYQIDFQERRLAENIGYFHARFNRTPILPSKEDYVILDKVCGKGKLVGVYCAYSPKSNGWWGEGEVKMFIDGDRDYPSYCGTGMEDYFSGAYNFEDMKEHIYSSHSGIYSGFYEIPFGDIYHRQQRFGMYRLHVYDPVYFSEDLKVTLQSLGWMSGMRFHPQNDDIASVAFFYLDRTCDTPPKQFTHDELENI